ncbi:hypothetical protein [Methanobrevibacter sp.]
MLNNKIKYVLVLFIILSLSMNAFSATNFTDDSDVALQSSDSVDEVAADEVADDKQADDSQNNDESASDADDSDKPTNGGSKFNLSSLTNGSSTFNLSSLGNGSSTFNFSGGSSFNFSSMNMSGMNFSNMSISDILSILNKLTGTNDTNETVDPEVTDVPEVVTNTAYSVPQPADVVKESSHVIKRLRDNKIISQGDVLTLDGLNKLYDSNFTNGHLLVYIDGKLVFNEITTDDVSTSIFAITDSYLGQHQIVVEFTPNDGNSNTNKYTEDVIIE